MAKETVLIVDDTETNIDILLGLLENHYDVVVAMDGESALEIVQEEAVDLILLDIMMPGMDGYEVCERLKAEEKTANIPVVFITAKNDEHSIERAYKTGGVDYVSKPFLPTELLMRVQTQLEYRKMIAKLEFLASKDGMTGCYNRRKFFEIAKERFADFDERIFGVMIDFDQFKSINDRYGHDVGDRVLIKVVQLLQEDFENLGWMGRMGGEEFAAIIRMESGADVMRLLEKLRMQIEKLRFDIPGADALSVSVSIGVARFDGGIENIDQLIKKADVALYKAKESGRNKVVFNED